MRQSSRLLGALLIVLLSQVAASHAAPGKPSTLTQPPLPPGMGEYIMVLWPPGSPLPSQSGPPVTVNVPEPDVAKLGGKVLATHNNERFILLPLAAASELRRHRAVAFLQRVWRGEPLAGWHTMLSVSPSSVPSKRTLRASPNGDTNLQWGPKAYTYDGSGNIMAVGTDQYVYDTADRLVQATLGSKTETYQYDAFGNLTQKGVTGYSPTVIPVDSASNRIAGVSYDAAGNVLSAENGQRTYKYDSLSALTRAQPRPSDRRILYDANDERIGMVLVNGDFEDIGRWTIRDFDGRLIREFKSDEGALSYWTWEEDFFYGEGALMGGEAVTFCLTDEGCWGGRRHYHLDHVGSVRLATDDTQPPAHARALSAHDYLPFGETVTQTYQEQINWGDPHIDSMRFAGHWRDFLGALNTDNTEYIDYMHARHFDPRLGRFLSVDVGQPTASRPSSWNRYTYSDDNPLKYVDRNGLYYELASASDRQYIVDAMVHGTANKAARELVLRQAADPLHKIVLGTGNLSGRGPFQYGDSSQMIPPYNTINGNLFPSGIVSTIDKGKLSMVQYPTPTITLFHELKHDDIILYQGIGQNAKYPDNITLNITTGQLTINSIFETFGRDAEYNHDDIMHMLSAGDVDKLLANPGEGAKGKSFVRIDCAIYGTNCQ